MRKHQTNFIILGYPRCGSTFLGMTLDSHRSIKMYLELFHHDLKTRQKYYRADNHVTATDGARKVRANSRYYQTGERGDDFLQEAVYYDRLEEKPIAVGFKIFYNHARNDEAAKTAWDFLTQNKEIRVIHLIRRNLLEERLSREQARISGKWTQYVGENDTPTEMPTLTLDPSECAEYFNRVLAYRAWVAKTFGEHPLIQISYEDDLLCRLEDTMLTLQGFLSIPAGRTKVVTVKQSRASTRCQIANYDELREHFRHTIHESYFVDG